MKKTYMTPAAEVIRIETVLLQSASSVGVKSGTVSDKDKLLGREGFFDDED